MAQTEQYRFPKDFWWGSSASATQTEVPPTETEKARIYGIIGLKKNRIVFLIMSGPQTHPNFTTTIKKISG